MLRVLRPSALAMASLVSLVLAGLAAASPCIPGCGTVTAEPFGSSSTAQGESTLIDAQWEHCLHTRDPWTVQCQTGAGFVFTSTLTGPPARCARGVLTVNGDVVDSTPYVCQG